MPDSGLYNDILFDKDTDALCALTSATLRLGGELLTDDRATLASDCNSRNIYIIFLLISIPKK